MELLRYGVWVYTNELILPQCDICARCGLIEYTGTIRYGVWCTCGWVEMNLFCRNVTYIIDAGSHDVWELLQCHTCHTCHTCSCTHCFTSCLITGTLLPQCDICHRCGFTQCVGITAMSHMSHTRLYTFPYIMHYHWHSCPWGVTIPLLLLFICITISLQVDNVCSECVGITALSHMSHMRLYTTSWDMSCIDKCIQYTREYHNIAYRDIACIKDVWELPHYHLYHTCSCAGQIGRCHVACIFTHAALAQISCCHLHTLSL